MHGDDECKGLAAEFRCDRGVVNVQELKKLLPERQTSMVVKKKAPKKRSPEALPKLTETEQDLLWRMEHGYRLETDSLGGDLVLRRLKDDEVLRPTAANRNTVKGLGKRGLITQVKSRDPLKITWQTR